MSMMDYEKLFLCTYITNSILNISSNIPGTKCKYILVTHDGQKQYGSMKTSPFNIK